MATCPGPTACPALAEAFREQTDVDCDLAFDGEPRELSSEARLAVYRTAQEALTNVRRHARPAHVDLRLRYEPAGTRLVVEDVRADGDAGPAADERERGLGYGLTGMRERAELLGRAPGGRADAPPASASSCSSRTGAGMAADPIRVLLADDQRVVREGLEMLLGLLPGIEVVGSAADGEEAVRLAVARAADVVLMDLRMPRMDGIEATRRLADARPAARVIALTTYADEPTVLSALRAGARGYLTKDAGAEEISRAIAAVARGEAALDHAVQHHVIGAVAQAEAAAPPDGLTPREAEVLVLIAEGLSNQEIAERLVVSPATVKTHVNRVFAKAGVRDRAQAVAYAYRSGLAGSP